MVNIYKSILKISLIGLYICLPEILWAQDGFFIPNPLVISDHTEKDQLHLSLGIGRGLDIHSSYAITNHISVFSTVLANKGTFAYTSFAGSKYKSDKNDHSYSGGLSYFFESKSNIRYETNLALAQFKTDNYTYFPGDKGTQTNTNYRSIFSQISATKDKEKYQVGFATRLSYSNYSSFQFYELDEPNYRNRYQNAWSVNIEPVGSFSVKIKGTKINFQGGISLPIITDYVKEYQLNLSTNEERLFTHSLTKPGFANFIGRVSIHHNFLLRKNK